jgi:hypothetical protein
MRSWDSPRFFPVSQLGAQSDQFSFGVHVGWDAKMVRASRYNANRSDRACILDLSSIGRRCDPCLLREDHELILRFQ